MNPPGWPDDLRVFDRGWLSSANLLCLGDEPALIDTGHVKDKDATVALMRGALAGRPLARIAHTHLHSDHCGGTGALQKAWPGVQTWVPTASFTAVRGWDESAFNYRATGQRCAPFGTEHALEIGGSVRLGQRDWQIHAAPGHDPLAIFLFNPDDRILVAGDALWAHGVGIIFPQIEGSDDFEPFERTLQAIESLRPRWVVPGHGATIAEAGGGIERALAQAHRRIAEFRADPAYHALHAARVMVKYQLMDVESMALSDFWAWADDTAVLHQVQRQYWPGLDWHHWLDEQVLTPLLAKGQLRQDATHIRDVQA